MPVGEIYAFSFIECNHRISVHMNSTLILTQYLIYIAITFHQYYISRINKTETLQKIFRNLRTKRDQTTNKIPKFDSRDPT